MAGIKPNLMSSYEKLKTEDKMDCPPTATLAVPAIPKSDRRRSSATITPLDHTQQGKRVTKVIVMASLASVFGSSFPNGYNTGALNSPLSIIKDFANTSYNERQGLYLENEPGDDEHILYAVIVAAYLLGAIPGASIAGFVAEKIGRKKSLLINLVFNYIGTILMACSLKANSFEMLITGRLIIGFQCGFGMVVCPMYLTECSVVSIRGGLGVLYQLTVTIGILTSQILGLKQVLGGPETWPWLLAFNAVPATFALILLPFCPESPKYLYFRKHGIEAHKVLQKLRGIENVSYDIRVMRKEREDLDREKKYNMYDVLTSEWHGKALFIAVVLNIAQQITGINAVFFYSNIIYSGAGMEVDEAQYVTIATGIINVISTIIAVKLVDKQGRRPLLLCGQIVMAAATVIITITLNLQQATIRTYSHEILPEYNTINITNKTELNMTTLMERTTTTGPSTVHFLANTTVVITDNVPIYNTKACAYISMICVFTFVIGFAIGLGCIPQFIGSELFRHDARPAAMSIACMTNWVGNFIIAISFPSIQDDMGPYTFLVFLVILTMVILFTYKFVPETKNLTIDEIEAILHPDQTYAEYMKSDLEMTEVKPLNNTLTS